VSEYPPRKLIKPDSSTSIEEDFTNHIEEFFESPKGYQASYPLLHKFFIERKSLLFLLIFIACVKIRTRELERYETMDQLWEKKAKKKDLVKVFGLPSEEVEQDIVYRPKQFPGSIVSAHFFASNGILEEQFILIHGVRSFF
jgi:hypothetical protein